jgi:hypothetical protein
MSERQYFHSSASPSGANDVAHHGRLAPLARKARPPSSVSGPVPYAPDVPSIVQLSYVTLRYLNGNTHAAAAGAVTLHCDSTLTGGSSVSMTP